MAYESVNLALADAKVDMKKVDQACVGYVYGNITLNKLIVYKLYIFCSILNVWKKKCSGDSACGQRALYAVGMTGIPIYNVNNNCSTGSSALYLGKQIIESKNADCVLVLGFEKMETGSLSAKVRYPWYYQVLSL